MRKVILQFVKAAFPLVAGLSAFMNSAICQQHIIVNKDNTRPETTARLMSVARITSFNVARENGYNDIQWSAMFEDDTRRFIIEYSTDGTDFRTAGEAIPVNGNYALKHHILGTHPLIYRVRIERKDGKFYTTDPFFLDGIGILPVTIYPTIVHGNTINVTSALPVERINIISSDGRQVYARDMGGIDGYNRVTIPVLNRGIYFVTFNGNGWKSTSKIMVGQ